MKKFKRFLSVILVIAFVISMVPVNAQAAKARTVKLWGVEINNYYTVYAKVGETIKWKEICSYNYDPENRYKSSNKGIASIDNKGTVKVKKTGTVTIRVSRYNNHYITLVCSKRSVKLSCTEKRLTVGKSFTLKLNGTTIKSVSVPKDEKKYVSVKKKGSKSITIKAVKAGIAVVSVKAKNGNTYKCTVTCNPTAEQVYNSIIAKKAKYPSGTPWEYQDYTAHALNTYQYYIRDGRGYRTQYSGGFCGGFAALMSNTAFGNLPGKEIFRSDVTEFNKNNVRVGDIIHPGDHAAVVIAVLEDGVATCEGNVNHEVSWYGDNIFCTDIDGSVPQDYHDWDSFYSYDEIGSIITRYASEAYTNDWYGVDRIDPEDAFDPFLDE